MALLTWSHGVMESDLSSVSSSHCLFTGVFQDLFSTLFTSQSILHPWALLFTHIVLAFPGITMQMTRLSQNVILLFSSSSHPRVGTWMRRRKELHSGRRHEMNDLLWWRLNHLDYCRASSACRQTSPDDPDDQISSSRFYDLKHRNTVNIFALASSQCPHLIVSFGIHVRSGPTWTLTCLSTIPPWEMVSGGHNITQQKSGGTSWLILHVQRCFQYSQSTFSIFLCT